MVHITRLSIDPENLPQDSFQSFSHTPPLATSFPSFSFLSLDSTCTSTNSKTVLTSKQSNKNHRTPFLPYVRPLKHGILGPAPSTSKEANVSPRRPSPLPSFHTPPKKPRPSDTHRVSQKRPCKRTKLKAITPAKFRRPPISSLMSPIQQLPCPLNPYVPHTSFSPFC